MKKLVKRVLPLVLAAVLVIGSCLTVHAEEPAIDYQHLTREQMLNLVNDFRNIVNQELYPVYKYQTFLYYRNSDGTYSSVEFFVSEQPFGTYNISGNWPKYSIFNSNDKSSRYYQFKVDGAGKISWSDIFTVNPNGRKDIGDARNQYDISNYSIVINGNTADYVAIPSASYDFFLVPPTPPVVATAVGAVDLTAVLKEIISLTPLLILFLVGLEAFWKGLRFLSSILHQA